MTQEKPEKPKAQPVEEKPVEEKPVEEKPVEEKPVEEKPVEEKPVKQMKTSDNAVLIGRKPVMNYVVACLTYFNSGEKSICVKARGRAISTAVDTVELLRRAFVKDLQIMSISIGTEEVQREEGRRSNVSTLEIAVARP